MKLGRMLDTIKRPSQQQSLSKTSKTEIVDFPAHIKTYVDTLIVIFNGLNPPHPLTFELHPFIFQDPATQIHYSDYTQATPYFLMLLEICFDRDTSPNLTNKAKEAAFDLIKSVTRSVSKER